MVSSSIPQNTRIIFFSLHTLPQGPGGTTRPLCPCPASSAQGPGPHISLTSSSVPAPVRPQQGWSPAPHCPALPRHGPTELGPAVGPHPSPVSAHPNPQGHAPCPGLGVPSCPAPGGVVGLALAARPCLFGHPGEQEAELSPDKLPC